MADRPCRHDPVRYPGSTELAHFGLTLSCLITMALVAKSVSDIRLRLVSQRRELRATLERVRPSVVEVTDGRWAMKTVWPTLSALAAIVIVVFWVYYGALIVIIGGEVSQVREDRIAEAGDFA